MMNDVLAFVRISSMWSLQDILELTDTPRYLAPEKQIKWKAINCLLHKLCCVYLKYALWNIYVYLKSSAKHSPIIQIVQVPPDDWMASFME